MNETTKIKDCSCGGRAIIRNLNDDKRPQYMIQCLDCMKCVYGGVNEIKALVIEKWNAQQN